MDGFRERRLSRSACSFRCDFLSATFAARAVLLSLPYSWIMRYRYISVAKRRARWRRSATRLCGPTDALTSLHHLDVRPHHREPLEHGVRHRGERVVPREAQFAQRRRRARGERGDQPLRLRVAAARARARSDDFVRALLRRDAKGPRERRARRRRASLAERCEISSSLPLARKSARVRVRGGG